MKHLLLVAILACAALLCAEGDAQDSLRTVDLSISGMEINGEPWPKPATEPAPAWDDMPERKLYRVNRAPATRTLYEKVDEWVMDCFISRTSTPSTRTECGYPMYGFDTDTGMIVKFLDRHGNITYDSGRMKSFEIGFNRDFYVLKNVDEYQIIDREDKSLIKSFPHRKNHSVSVYRNGLAHIEVIVDKEIGGYHSNIWAEDPYERVKQLTNAPMYIAVSDDLSYFVARDVMETANVVFYSADYSVITTFAETTGKSGSTISISPNDERVVFDLNNNTYLTDRNGGVIKVFNGLGAGFVVWSPSGDSFWMNGLVCQAEDGKVIGKIYGGGPALSDMDAHRIVFGAGLRMSVFDYETNEKIFYVDNSGTCSKVALSLISGDAKTCVVYYQLDGGERTGGRLGARAEVYREIGGD